MARHDTGDRFAPRQSLDDLNRMGGFAARLDELTAPPKVFRSELRRLARAAGLRVLTSTTDASFVAWVPDWEMIATPEQLAARRAAIRAAVEAADDGEPAASRRHLRAVEPVNPPRP
ncbi:hypothetical protein [Agromyces larvae]|uniref:Uncharacterized protein n=1 Tax=Agromyces larvae TaxID=2929802 RepID=A0ABY4C551_9MICO|nr:hypothetical protein [Agromyces larvae]UOE45286.1 hypothetical protein MTO99_05845 [Agromyces larvae]